MVQERDVHTSNGKLQASAITNKGRSVRRVPPKRLPGVIRKTSTSGRSGLSSDTRVSPQPTVDNASKEESSSIISSDWDHSEGDDLSAIKNPASASNEVGSNNIDIIEQDVSSENMKVTEDLSSQQELATKCENLNISPEVTTSMKPKKRKTYKETQFKKLISADRIHLAKLRTAAWNGIPTENRSLAWKVLLNYMPTIASTRENIIKRKRAEYSDIVKKFWDNVPDSARSNSEQMSLRQVLVDIPRTLPGVTLFQNQRIRDMMARLLYLYALRNPSTGYVQGFNELICPFLIVYLGGYYGGREVRGCQCKGDQHEYADEYFCVELITDEQLAEVEADAFHSLAILLSKIQTHYTEDQPGLQKNILKLSKVIKRVDIPLNNHLMDEGMMYQQMCFRWFHNFLIRETSISNIIRMWDTYLSSVPSGFEHFHLFVCAAIIVQHSENLRNMRLEEIFRFIQDLNYTDDIEVLLSQAYVLSTLFEGNEAHLE